MVFFHFNLACIKNMHLRPVQTLELLLSRYPGAAGISHEDENGHQFPLHDCLERIDINGSEELLF